jgi:hypothetical protein
MRNLGHSMTFLLWYLESERDDRLIVRVSEMSHKERPRAILLELFALSFTAQSLSCKYRILCLLHTHNQ